LEVKIALFGGNVERENDLTKVFVEDRPPPKGVQLNETCKLNIGREQ
jgi:hypothetical protein